jgi:hypothetical protein
VGVRSRRLTPAASTSALNTAGHPRGSPQSSPAACQCPGVRPPTLALGTCVASLNRAHLWICSPPVNAKEALGTQQSRAHGPQLTQLGAGPSGSTRRVTREPHSSRLRLGGAAKRRGGGRQQRPPTRPQVLGWSRGPRKPEPIVGETLELAQAVARRHLGELLRDAGHELRRRHGGGHLALAARVSLLEGAPDGEGGAGG